MSILYLFVLGRILVGGYFIMSGVNHFQHLKMLTGYAQSKGVPMPRGAVQLSGLMMLLGGAGILLGVLIGYSVLLLTLFLFCVSFKMHDFWNVSDPMQKMGEKINFTKNMALLGAILMFLAIPLAWWAFPLMM
jgi:putative oxidoreductase